MIRKPAVAGKFYPSNKDELNKLITDIFNKEKSKINYSLSKKKIIGAVVPHAGYMFSAYEAIHFFEIIKYVKTHYDTIIILNPDHHGYGPSASLDTNDKWESPFGVVEIDKDFYTELPFTESKSAHQYEHSGEVMLPLLQYSLDYPFKILPISISKQTIDNSLLIANSIYKANRVLNKKILLIASSDFSHFVDPEEGKKLDDFVIDHILKLDSQGVIKTIRSKNISVCGYGPITTLIEYSKLINKNTKTEVLRRGNSGDVIPSSEVVDYVTILFYNIDI
ncbi:MAG: AmmeMemoRadiSam system protein B [Bacteroidales bacterium]|nr:AmmeMemoRadiSam system protein B [Bacteroidales bacterium]